MSLDDSLLRGDRRVIAELLKHVDVDVDETADASTLEEVGVVGQFADAVRTLLKPRSAHWEGALRDTLVRRHKRKVAAYLQSGDHEHEHDIIGGDAKRRNALSLLACAPSTPPISSCSKCHTSMLRSPLDEVLLRVSNMRRGAAVVMAVRLHRREPDAAVVTHLINHAMSLRVLPIDTVPLAMTVAADRFREPHDVKGMDPRCAVWRPLTMEVIDAHRTTEPRFPLWLDNWHPWLRGGALPSPTRVSSLELAVAAELDTQREWAANVLLLIVDLRRSSESCARDFRDVEVFILFTQPHRRCLRAFDDEVQTVVRLWRNVLSQPKDGVARVRLLGSLVAQHVEHNDQVAAYRAAMACSDDSLLSATQLFLRQAATMPPLVRGIFLPLVTLFGTQGAYSGLRGASPAGAEEVGCLLVGAGAEDSAWQTEELMNMADTGMLRFAWVSYSCGSSWCMPDWDTCSTLGPVASPAYTRARRAAGVPANNGRIVLPDCLFEKIMNLSRDPLSHDVFWRLLRHICSLKDQRGGRIDGEFRVWDGWLAMQGYGEQALRAFCRRCSKEQLVLVVVRGLRFYQPSLLFAARDCLPPETYSDYWKRAVSQIMHTDIRLTVPFTVYHRSCLHSGDAVCRALAFLIVSSAPKQMDAEWLMRELLLTCSLLPPSRASSVGWCFAAHVTLMCTRGVMETEHGETLLAPLPHPPVFPPIFEKRDDDGRWAVKMAAAGEGARVRVDSRHWHIARRA